jgi:CRISPR-associated endonuclease Cas2
MPRPPKAKLTLAEALAKLREAGIHIPPAQPKKPDDIDSLKLRIQKMLHIIQASPIKATEMNFLIMYDIADDRVRGYIAKYLLRQGCVRIQRSVFIARSENKHFQEILDTLKEVNAHYENEDSIILVPVNASDVRSMKLIGKNIQLETLTDPPNTLFF